MRLIDADALMQSMGCVDAVKYGNKTVEQQHNSYSTMMMYEIADCIECAPTIDAVPVVHARWKTVKNSTYCSACNAFLPAIAYTFYDHDDEWERCEEIDKTRYCPYCGAKMDGGANDGSDS